MKKILIAIDYGPTSEKVATAGLELRKHFHAEIALVSVVDSKSLTTDGTVATSELLEDMIRITNVNHKLIIQNLFKYYKVRTFVEVGTPSEAIIRVASEWEADIVVLGARGKKGMSQLPVGSVAEKVIRHSSKPLFVIPTN